MLDRNATTEEILDMVNELYGAFVEQCIRENHAYANQQDVNDSEVNSKSASKVSYSV